MNVASYCFLVAVMSIIWLAFWAGSVVFAANYSSPCPEFCAVQVTSDHICHPKNNFCLHGCQTGYVGLKCLNECQKEIYGEGCNSDCPRHCSRFSAIWFICHHISGECLKGCRPGFQGLYCERQCDRGYYEKNCKSLCPQHCEDLNPNRRICHHILGVCTQGCKPGYLGRHCDEQCHRETYGQDCSFDCPQYCKDVDSNRSVCDHLSGICTQGCRIGHTGIRCDEECDRGSYGQDCNSTCPLYCENVNRSRPVCHHISGNCLQGCQPGYRMDYCDEPCSIGLYGEKCIHSCPLNCKVINEYHTACHHIEGSCLNGCQAGWKGAFCEKECEPGWFGESCKYKCRCLHQDTCGTNNSCIVKGETLCNLGWFGPDCQYVDLAQGNNLVNLDENLRTLTDRNDSTCLPPDTTAITVSWSQPYILTWLRIRLSEAVILPQYFNNLFSVTFSDKSTSYSCDSLKLARDSETIDIYCKVSAQVTQLSLTGPGVGYLCSLHVSGGRNVASREKTSQTSTSKPPYHKIKPESYLAVDGNIDEVMKRRGCTMTDENDPNPTWHLTFTVPVAVSRFVIYGWFGDNGFILTATDSTGKNVYLNQDHTQGRGEFVYQVVPPHELLDVSGLSIQATNTGNTKRNFLQLCEVEVFGDSVCDVDYYGRGCEHYCTCNGPCFTETGRCRLWGVW